MMYGMLSKDPFEFFDRGYGYNSSVTCNPWSGFSSYQQPFAGYRQPRSSRRFMRTPSRPSFWDIPVQTEEEEDIESRTRNDFAPKSRGKCSRPQTAQVHDRRTHRSYNQDDSAFPAVGSMEVPAMRKERSKTPEGGNMNSSSLKRKACRRKRRDEDEEEPPASVCQLSKLKLEDPHEEEERNQIPRDNTTKEIPREEEENLNKKEAVPQSSKDKMVIENDDSGETHQPEAEVNEEANEQPTEMDRRTAEETMEAKESDDDDQESNSGEEEEDEGEPESAKQEDEVKKKLEVIETKLHKARELIPEEVLSAPRTDKQRLYLTEMLLRCILDLDMIEAEGDESVRLSRKEAVREIQSYLDQIENNSS